MAPAASDIAGPRHALSTRLIVGIVLSATLLVGAAFAVGRASAPVIVSPTTTSAEAGFARDMQTHHDQAVELSLIVRDLTDDPEVRLLAYDIATAQSQQSGQLFAWLEVWGLPQASPEPSMTWMSRPLLDGATHGHGADEATHEPGGPMPGLATREQLATLQSLSGVEAEKFFLELMVTHHVGGIEMAEAIVIRSDESVVTALAGGMIAVQQKEIDYMNDLIAERS